MYRPVPIRMTEFDDQTTDNLQELLRYYSRNNVWGQLSPTICTILEELDRREGTNVAHLVQLPETYWKTTTDPDWRMMGF